MRGAGGVACLVVCVACVAAVAQGFTCELPFNATGTEVHGTACGCALVFAPDGEPIHTGAVVRARLACATNFTEFLVIVEGTTGSGEGSGAFYPVDTGSTRTAECGGPRAAVVQAAPPVPVAAVVVEWVAPDNEAELVARAVVANVSGTECGGDTSYVTLTQNITVYEHRRPTGGFVSYDGVMEVQWVVDKDKGEVELGVQKRSAGWLAVGIANQPGMDHVDMYVGWDGDHAEFVEAWSTGYERPTKRDSPTTLDHSLTVTTTATTMWFRRALQGADPGVTVVLDKHVSQYLVWAHGPSAPSSFSSLPQHKRAGTVKVNFLEGTASDIHSDNLLRSLHAQSMIAAWGLIAPVAVLLARFGKSSRCLVVAHRVLMVVAWLVAAFGLSAVYSVVDHRHSSLKSTHGSIGLTVFIVAFAHGLFGALRPKKGIPRRTVWFMLHSLLGRALLLLAISNLFIGFTVFGSSADKARDLFIGFLVLLALVWLGLEAEARVEGPAHHTHLPFQLRLPLRRWRRPAAVLTVPDTTPLCAGS